jgi:oxaloacetate decarboxylase gamma subunit
MPVTELLLDGLRLMLIGMGIVFAFLLLLVAVLRVMSGFAKRVGPEPPAAEALSPGIGRGYPVQPDQGELPAVIAAAIARYRSDRRRS